MKVKVSEATGVALDWMVAKCEDVEIDILPEKLLMIKDDVVDWHPSTDWAEGGPIIEREGIAVDCIRCDGQVDGWVAGLTYQDAQFDGFAYAEITGPTPLIAAMRCYVVSKLGYEVEVPDDLS